MLQKETKEQNEILSLTSNKIIHSLADAIYALPVVSFSVVTDGIKDISGQQKESIRLHYVDITRFHKGHLWAFFTHRVLQEMSLEKKKVTDVL